MLALRDDNTDYNMRLLTRTDTNEVTHKEPAGFELHVGTRQDPGLKRKYRPNEDTLSITQGVIPAISPALAPQPFALLQMADGMGGHTHGKEASMLATHALSRYVTESLRSQPQSSGALLLLLKAGIEYANQIVFEHNQRQGTSMGTTMTAAIVVAHTVYIAHVGDSRLYIYHEPNGLTQITLDHSVVAELAAAGIIKHEDIYTHPWRNQIYRSLGKDSFVDVDMYAVPLAINDILLLCSDGLWEMVRDTQIANILTTPMFDPADAADALIVAALEHGGDDNVSAIVAQANKGNKIISFG
jgi:serine/threonine protein phosphatase PrpC